MIFFFFTLLPPIVKIHLFESWGYVQNGVWYNISDLLEYCFFIVLAYKCSWNYLCVAKFLSTINWHWQFACLSSKYLLPFKNLSYIRSDYFSQNYNWRASFFNFFKCVDFIEYVIFYVEMNFHVCACQCLIMSSFIIFNTENWINWLCKLQLWKNISLKKSSCIQIIHIRCAVPFVHILVYVVMQASDESRWSTLKHISEYL